MAKEISGVNMRSIPTCVGSPIRRAHCKVLRRVYPHVCGVTEL